MSLEHLARAHAKLSGQEIERYLNKGNFGEAYLTTDNHVIKVTKDAKEALASAKMVGIEHESLVTIFDVKKAGSDHYIISQSYCNHNSDADEMFWRINEFADRVGEDIDELVEVYGAMPFDDPNQEVYDDEVHSAIAQIKEASDFLSSQGVGDYGVDLASDNFAYFDGKITVFDFRVSEDTQERCKERLMQEHPEVFQSCSVEHEASI